MKKVGKCIIFPCLFPTSFVPLKCGGHLVWVAKNNGYWNKAHNPLSVARLAHAAVFYYEIKELLLSGSTEAERNEQQRRLDKQLRRCLAGTINLAVSIYEGERKVSDFFGLLVIAVRRILQRMDLTRSSIGNPENDQSLS